MVLKAADMLELVLHAMEAMKNGDQNAAPVIVNGEIYLKEMGLPEEMMEKITALVMEVKYGSQ